MDSISIIDNANEKATIKYCADGTEMQISSVCSLNIWSAFVEVAIYFMDD